MEFFVSVTLTKERNPCKLLSAQHSAPARLNGTLKEQSIIRGSLYLFVNILK